jgi:hypothetical protein
MTTDELFGLRCLAEAFRQRATRVEGTHGKLKWVQTCNVIEAFEQCALEVEHFAAGGVKETELQNSQNPAPAQPEQTANAS